MRGRHDFFKRCETGLHRFQPSLRTYSSLYDFIQHALDHTALCSKLTTLIIECIYQLLIFLATDTMHRTTPSSCMSQQTHRFDRCYYHVQLQLSLKVQFQAFMSGYLSTLSIVWNSLMHIIHSNTPSTRYPISLHSLTVPPQLAELSEPCILRLAPFLIQIG